MWIHSQQRTAILNLTRDDPGNLRQTIAAIHTVLPFYESDEDGYVLFETRDARLGNVDGPLVRVPHDLSHAFVGEEHFGSLEEVVEFAQRRFGKQPPRQSVPEIGQDISPEASAPVSDPKQDVWEYDMGDVQRRLRVIEVEYKKLDEEVREKLAQLDAKRRELEDASGAYLQRLKDGGSGAERTGRIRGRP